MDYNKSIETIKISIKNREYKVAEERLLSLISESTFKNIEDENNTYYSFNNYIESLLFWNIYKPQKKNITPDINYAEVYYYLGYISIENKNFGKALEYLQNGLKRNPVDMSLMLEIATIHKMTGNIEKFKAQIEKAHAYIYNSSYMARYFRELGWYYTEKRIFDLANALYSYSMSFNNTEVAKNELIFIAKQENRDLKISTNQEIRQLLLEYNIPTGFNKSTIQIIFNEYQYLNKNKPDTPILNFLRKTLYDITLDKQFMLYTILKDEKLGVSIKVPEHWKYLEKSAYEKYNISKNTIFLLRTSNNRNVSITCDGKCTNDKLEDAYSLNINNMKKQGMEIISEYAIEGEKNIKQVFVDTKQGDKIFRVFQNFLVVNDYLFNVSWEVPNNIKIEQLYNSISNSFEMDVVWSLNKLDLEEQKQNIEIDYKSIEPNDKVTVNQEVLVDNNELENVQNKNKENKLKVYYQEMEGYPTFKFYFPENLGEQSKVQNNIFELRENNKQIIRVMISKCPSEEKLEELANNWIEKTRTTNKQIIKSFSIENVGNIKVLSYILGGDKQLDKIYKMIYKDKCWITISGTLKENKSDIINTAIEKLEVIENKNEDIQTVKAIVVDCSNCNNSFELKWNVPASEKTFYCKCPKCGMELKKENPNYKKN